MSRFAQLLCVLVIALFAEQSAAWGDARPSDAARQAPGPAPVRDPIDLYQRFRGAPPEPVDPAPSHWNLGDQDSFYVLDQSVSGYVPIQATLELIGERSYWWTQTGQKIDRMALEQAAAKFDAQTLPTIEDFFDPIPRIAPITDRVHVLNANAPGAAAYFSSVDAYPRYTHPYSNGRPVLIMNVGVSRPGNSDYDETLAHELQHLIHWKVNPGDDTWMDEGSAELAASLVRGSPGRGSNFTRQPDRQLTAWGADGGSLSGHYDAAYLFVQYLTDRYGPAAVGGVIRTGRSVDGISGYLASSALQERFKDVFADWVVANVGGSDRDARPTPYRYDRARPEITPVGAITLSADRSDTVRQFGTDYLEIDASVTALELELDAQVALAPVPDTGDDRVWWSGRGDSIDSMLTRSVDLTSVTIATLQFRTWYRIEANYDYGYVSASRDNGASWTALPGSTTTSENRLGNAYGPGFTGLSAQDDWIDESIDLTPFVGSSVLLRFELVNDQADSLDGWLVGGIRIPEIDYRDSTEDFNWNARGFVRTSIQRSASYLVQVIQGSGANLTVDRRWLDGGLTRIALPSERSGRIIIAISGTAADTLIGSGYRIHAISPNDAVAEQR